MQQLVPVLVPAERRLGLGLLTAGLGCLPLGGVQSPGFAVLGLLVGLLGARDPRSGRPHALALGLGLLGQAAVGGPRGAVAGAGGALLLLLLAAAARALNASPLGAGPWPPPADGPTG
jgi:hypothetical protein